MAHCIKRFESNGKYGYELTFGDIVKFFDDTITGNKQNSLRCAKAYLTNAPKVYPKREVLHTDEFKNFCAEIISSDDLQKVELTKSSIQITSCINKMKIENGVRLQYWDVDVVDHNGTQYHFEYNMEHFKTQDEIIEDLKQKYDITIVD